MNGDLGTNSVQARATNLPKLVHCTQTECVPVPPVDSSTRDGPDGKASGFKAPNVNLRHFSLALCPQAD